MLLRDESASEVERSAAYVCVHIDAAGEDEHYTRVTLEGITESYKQLLDVGELKRIASQVLPSEIDPGFQHQWRPGGGDARGRLGGSGGRGHGSAPG